MPSPADGPVYWDPYDVEIDRNPYEIWRRLRDEAPVYHNDRYGFWAISRFDDVLAASLDTERFSSAYGLQMDMIPHHIDPPPMIMMDPPEHDVMRKMVNRVFTPRRMAEMEDRVHELCAGYLDPWVGSAGMDYVHDFGMRLPVIMISSMLGFPESDHDMLRELSDDAISRDGSAGPTDRGMAALAQLYEYYGEQIAERRRRPRDDMTTDLMHGELTELDGSTRHLSDGELQAFISLLNLAGNETVARLLGWAAKTLAEWPRERARLVADPGLISAGIEELLRFEPPSPVQGRYTLVDVDLHDTTIPAHVPVALMTGAAGRDDHQYPEPDRFDVGRGHERHLSFGYGAHFCVGAALARLEGRVALEETLARWPEWDCDPAAIEMVATNTVRGPSRAPITF